MVNCTRSSRDQAGAKCDRDLIPNNPRWSKTDAPAAIEYFVCAAKTANRWLAAPSSNLDAVASLVWRKLRCLRRSPVSLAVNGQSRLAVCSASSSLFGPSRNEADQAGLARNYGTIPIYFAPFEDAARCR